MSSLRNSVQRRSYRERAQPKERERLGILEKHKDYALRAKDYNKKKKTLKSLREKAAARNEDEFYFGMLSRKGPGSKVTQGKGWSGTVIGDRGNRSLSVDVVRLLKTQDIGYLRTIRNVAAKEVKDLEQRAIMAGAISGEAEEHEEEEEDDDDDDEEREVSRPQKTKKIVFVDDAEEQAQAVPPTRKQQDLDDEDEDMEDDKDEDDTEADAEASRKAENAARLRRKLQNARKKLKALTDAETELELQRARMAKTATSGGFTKSGQKIKVRERKR